MLVLKRAQNEKVRIGSNIWVTVVAINGDRVKLGFDAPRDVEVHREEIAQLIDRQDEERRVPR